MESLEAELVAATNTATENSLSAVGIIIDREDECEALGKD